MLSFAPQNDMTFFRFRSQLRFLPVLPATVASLLALGLTSGMGLAAQDSPPATPVAMSLNDYVRRVLEHNESIQMRALESEPSRRRQSSVVFPAPVPPLMRIFLRAAN